MPYINVAGLPKSIRAVLPVLAQGVFLSSFNSAFKKTDSDESAMQAGWAAVKKAGFKKGTDGTWQRYSEDEAIEYGAIKDMEIFEVGTHTTSAGQVIKTTLDQLKSIAEFSTELARKGKHHAPIKLGHVKDKGLPALGWAEKFKVVGNKLFADVVDIPEKLIKAIVGKSWRKRSIEIYPDYEGTGKQAVRGIALLGADIPSVKGLDDIVAQYSVNETEEVQIYDFNEYAETFNCECIKCGYKMTSDKHCNTFNCPECGGSMRRTERPGAGQPAYEELEKLEKEVLKLQEEVKELKTQLANGELDNNKKNKQEVDEMTEQELKQKEELLAKEKKEFEEKKVEMKKQEDEQKEKEARFAEKQKKEATAKFESDVTALIDEYKENGKLLPSQENDIRNMAIAYGENRIIKFSEAGKEVERPVLDVLKSMLEKNVKQVDFAETAKEGKDGKEKELTKYSEFEKKVKEYMKDNKDVNYATAVVAVGEEEPKLYEEYQEEAVAEGDTSGKSHNSPAVSK